MRLVTRSVLREIWPPFLLGLAAYTFIILLRSLLDLAGLMLRGGSTFGAGLRLLALTLPNVVVLTLPMSLLLAILVGVGRMSADSEVVALKASGVGLAGLYRPILLFSGILGLFVLFLTTEVYPRTNELLGQETIRLAANAIVQRVQPRVFSRIDDRVFFANRAAVGGPGWDDVLISDHSDPQAEKVIIARTATFRVDHSALWLDLTDATTHEVDPADPSRYQRYRNAFQSILIKPALEATRTARARLTFDKGLRSQTLSELYATERRVARQSPDRYRLAWVEIHKRFSIAAACLVFGLLALPLGLTNRRGGKGSGFAVSLGIILLYYVLLNNGENWAEEGRISPALAMWLPNVLFFGCALVAILRSRREHRSWRDRFAEIANRLLPRRRVGARISIRRRRRPVFRFPSLMDRYVLARFLSAAAIVFASVILLYVIVDYSDQADEILSHHIPAAVVAQYYRASLFPMINDVAPFAILISSLIALGLFSRYNEDTACKAGGISTFRLGAPVLVLAFLTSGLAYLDGEYILPTATREANELRNVIHNRPRNYGLTMMDRTWLLGGHGLIWNYDAYDRDHETLIQPALYQFDAAFQLTTRIGARTARWTGSGWEFEQGWVRTFSGPLELSFTRFRRRIVHVPERPRDFAAERRHPEEMRYRELARYIDRLSQTGYPIADLETALYGKIAQPLAILIMAFLALPFAFSIGKRGALTGIGVALGLGMAFLVVSAFASKLGQVGALPPILAAWSPNAIFAMAAGYRMLQLRT
jgi:LPS export ABC transporter permease LptG/LPS export ABC transporter permease LptF